MAIHFIGTDGNTNACIGGVWNHETSSSAWSNPLLGATELRGVLTITPTGLPTVQGGVPSGTHALIHCGRGIVAASNQELFRLETYLNPPTVMSLQIFGDNGGPNLIYNAPPPTVGEENRIGFRWRASDGRVEIWINGVNVTQNFGGSSPAHLNTSPGAPLEIGAQSYSDVFCWPGDYAEGALWTSYGTDLDMINYGLHHHSPNILPTQTGRVEYIDFKSQNINGNQITGRWTGATAPTAGSPYGLATRLYGGSGGDITQPYQGLHSGYSVAASHPDVVETLPTVVPKYFVKTGGNNAADGLSDANAWATLAKVNATTLVPGDVVGFRGGDSFAGTLEPTIPSGGDPNNPIIFTAYGTGKATILPAAHTTGMEFRLKQGIEVKKFIITGTDTAYFPVGHPLDAAAGIFCGWRLGDLGTDNVILRHIVIEDCEVSGFQLGIWVMGNAAANTNATFDGVTIRRCDAHHNVGTGIAAETVAQQDHSPVLNPIMTNVLIQDCTANDNFGIASGSALLYGSQGNGIFLDGVDGAVIERCTAARNGQASGEFPAGPCGILVAFTRNLIVQYCEVYDTGRNTGAGGSATDGGGIDFDLNCIKCIGQYNYTHGNRVGGLMLFGAFASDVGTQANVFRYNISEDDGVVDAGAIWVHASQGGLFYGNTIFARLGTPRCAVKVDTSSTHIKLYNNLFITSGAGGKLLDIAGNSLTGFEARGNDYWQIGDSGSTFRAVVSGVTYTSLAAFRAGTGLEAGTGFNLDPLLTAPGAGGTVNNPPALVPALSGYQLQTGSPMAGQGLDLDLLFPGPPATNPGLVDFYGNTLPLTGNTTLGASLVNGGPPPETNPINPPTPPLNVVSALPSTLNTGGQTRFCHVGENLQAAMNACAKGDVLVLDDGGVWVGEVFPPDRPGPGWITICSASAFSGALTPGIRVTRADAPKMAHLRTEAATNLLTCPFGGYRFIGLELSSNYVHPTNTIFNLIIFGQSASRFSMERCWVHGRLASELGSDSSIRHALTADASDVRVQQCRFDGISNDGDGNQAQAIYSANTAGTHLIHDNFLEAPGECLMYGGEDPVVANRVPSDLTITNNTVSWNTAWWPLTQATGWGDLRNLIELKNARRVLIEGNTLQNCWVSNVLITPRNQGHTAPWCTVEDVMIRNNKLIGYSPPGSSGASGFLVTIGLDNEAVDAGSTSGTMARIAVINNLMLGCEWEFWNHTDQRARCPDLWIEHNTVLPCRYRGTTVNLVDPPIGGFLRARVANNVFGVGDRGSDWLGSGVESFAFQSVVNRNVVVYIPPGLYDGGGVARAVPPAVVSPRGWFIDPPNAEGLDVATGIIAAGSPMLTFGCDINGVADGTPVGVDHVALEAALAGGGEPEVPIRRRAKGFRASSIRT